MANITIHMVRHAPVIGQDGYIYGDNAEVDLYETVDTLKELGSTLPPPSDTVLWFSSGVPRTVQTAEKVLQYSTTSADKNSIKDAPQFREQDFGDLIGQRHEDITDHLRFHNGNIYCPAPPNGESLPDFIERVGQAAMMLAVDAAEQNISDIVIFTHGGVIRAQNMYMKYATMNKYKKPESYKHIVDMQTPPLYYYKQIFGV